MRTTSDVGSAIAASSQPAAPDVTHDSPEQSVNRHRPAAATSATNGGARAMNGPTDRSRRRYAIGPAGTATVASGCTRIAEMLGPTPRSGGDAPSPGPVPTGGARVHDGWAVALAAATALGGWLALPVPRWLGAVAIVAALAARRPALLCLGAALLAGALSVAAWAGTAPVPVSPFHGAVTLVTDPETVGRGTRAEV